MIPRQFIPASPSYETINLTERKSKGKIFLHPFGANKTRSQSKKINTRRGDCHMEHKHRTYLILFLLVVWLRPQQTLGYHQDSAPPQPTKQTNQVGQIDYFLNPPLNTLVHATLANEKNIGILPGMVLEAQRQSNDLKLPTGKIKVIKVEERVLIGEVIAASTPISETSFRDYPQIMSSDQLVRPLISVERIKVFSPQFSISYFDLFKNPRANPNTFELSDAGKEKLIEMAQHFENSRAGKLLIKGHTDHNGPSDANQIESYQRALIIKEFLVEKLNFDPDRIITMGLGESQLIDRSLVSGYIKKNRRIEIEALSISAQPKDHNQTFH